MLILMAQWKNKVALITGLSKGIREVEHQNLQLWEFR
jgi:hypothetical protein